MRNVLIGVLLQILKNNGERPNCRDFYRSRKWDDENSWDAEVEYMTKMYLYGYHVCALHGFSALGLAIGIICTISHIKRKY